MANDDRSGSVGDAPVDDVRVTGGSTNPFGSARGNGGPAYAPMGPSALTNRSTASTRPAPAVPLVPPVRANTRPAAPVARTGSSSAATATVVTARQPAPATAEQPATGSTPSPPAPARTRPPVRIRMARRPRIRKVNRVVRRVDAWSVFKIALVFWAVVFAILLVAGMLLWNLAESTGTITNVEGFVKDLFGLKSFEVDGGSVLRAAWILGIVLVVGGTACTVTLAVLFNLISDLLGGVRVTVLEEEVVLRPAPQPVPPSTDGPVTTSR